MELKKIVKSTSFLVISKTIQFTVGIIRSKLAAIYIGTIGVGVFSQVSYLVTMISNLSLLSMNDGLVKQIAEKKDSEGFKEQLKGLIKSYSILIVLASSIAIIICIIFSKQLTIFFIGDEKYLLYYLFGITCIPITIANSLSFALLKSYKATKYISRSNITSSIITLLFFVPLIYLFKTTGAVISVAINFLVLLIVNNLQVRIHILSQIGMKFKEVFKSKIDKKYTKDLLYFAFYGATTGLLLLVSESICRSMVVNKLGIEKFGIYSPITAWSNLLSGFILPSLSTYLYPRFSECKTNAEISDILNDSLRLVSFLMAPFLFIAIPYRLIIIPIFYSREFIEAGNFLPYHFIGMLFYMWWYALALVLTPTGRIRTYSIFIFFMALTNLITVYLFVPKFGLYGWMLKFIISPIVFYCLFFSYLRKEITFTINNSNLFIMIYLLISSFILILIDSSKLKYFLPILFIGLCYFFLTRNEKQYLIKKLNFRC
jgi:O-antigen/teichoic acid export membrane protein